MVTKNQQILNRYWQNLYLKYPFICVACYFWTNKRNKIGSSNITGVFSVATNGITETQTLDEMTRTNSKSNVIITNRLLFFGYFRHNSSVVTDTKQQICSWTLKLFRSNHR